MNRSKHLRQVLAALILGALMLAQAQPPPPPVEVEGGSRVAALVLRYSVWSPQALLEKGIALEAGRRVYSYWLELKSAEPIGPGLRNPARAGMQVEAYSLRPLPLWVGKEVEATLELRGEVPKVNWWINTFRLR
ncbi:hypothetical protein [Calidithermus roseus]|uniref:Uncharacterized protein n=1 Tax=Calidithermus roseus TaxID=1644118 RepID=A0A399F1Z2_9DEIN|nr:hypothetical protein [Calidithermus roseus]RIH89815.1 hypothetical protein Mrose_00040 [Calidithermus roseus]